MTRAEKPYEPLPYRIWAVLHYLADQSHKDKPNEFLKFSHIEAYLRGNHPATKELIDFLMKRGLADKSEKGSTYHITPEGEKWLPKFAEAFERLYHDSMEPFRERKR